MSEGGRCIGKTLNGSQCRRTVGNGHQFCFQHAVDSSYNSDSQKTEFSASPISPKINNMKSPRLKVNGNNKTNGGVGVDGVNGSNGFGGLLRTAPEKSLYERLGGIYSIAAVVDMFSEEILDSPLVGVNSPNPQLREWSRSHQEDRLPGLKWMRTLWASATAGGPYKYIPTKPGSTHMGLDEAHRNLRISPEEFDEIIRILAMTLDYFKVPSKEKDEVLTAFVARKPEIIRGYLEATKQM